MQCAAALKNEDMAYSAQLALLANSSVPGIREASHERCPVDGILEVVFKNLSKELDIAENLMDDESQ